MNNLSMSAIALAIGLSFSAGSMAQVQPKEGPADSKMMMKEGPADSKMMTKEAPAGVSKDAATEKRDADYAVAKEKCDALADEARLACMNQAKAMHGKS